MSEEPKRSGLREAKDHVEALATGFKYFIDPHRITLDYPAEAMELPKNYRGFFRLVDEKCIGCSLCEIICPSNAIVMNTIPVSKPVSQQAQPGSVPQPTSPSPATGAGASTATSTPATAPAAASATPAAITSARPATPPPRPAPTVKKRPVIDWGMCIFCYFCVDVCPTEAFEPSTIHDLSYFEEAEYRPTFEGFLKLPESPSKGAKKVVARPDEKKGIRYEEVREEPNGEGSKGQNKGHEGGAKN